MSKRETISRYNLIINKLRRNPSSFSQISEYLATVSEIQGYDFNISKRTFQRDIDDIRSLYNIDIRYDYSLKGYYIDLDQQPEINERIFEAFDIFNALNISERLSDVIFFENRRPQGTQNLYGLLHSVKNQLQLNFVYQKFNDEKPDVRNVQPLALKEFRNRWYLLGKDIKDEIIKCFSLDRLSELEITRVKFEKPSGFDVDSHFRNSFGIISPNDNIPRQVILSFNALQGKYIKTLPLHRSQQIIRENKKEMVVKLEIFITYDFIMELLSFGPNVRVLQPSELVNAVKTALKNALDQY
jgi:predicted DNA-binding transcriptional regulator YafY